MFCAWAVVPSTVAGKRTVAGDTTTAASAATPVPLKETVCGEFGASSEMVSVAVRCPKPKGKKVTVIEQLPDGGIAAVHPLATEKSGRFAPASEAELT